MKPKRKTRLPSNWQDRIEITRHDTSRPYEENVFNVEFNLAFKRGQTPKGFSRGIGNLTVCSEFPHVVEDSNIDKYFRRRGLGTLLYTHALSQFGLLTTDYHSASSTTQHLWQSLILDHHHETNFFDGTLTIFPQRRNN